MVNVLHVLVHAGLHQRNSANLSRTFVLYGFRPPSFVHVLVCNFRQFSPKATLLCYGDGCTYSSVVVFIPVHSCVSVYASSQQICITHISLTLCAHYSTCYVSCSVDDPRIGTEEFTTVADGSPSNCFPVGVAKLPLLYLKSLTLILFIQERTSNWKVQYIYSQKDHCSNVGIQPAGRLTGTQTISITFHEDCECY